MNMLLVFTIICCISGATYVGMMLYILKGWRLLSQFEVDPEEQHTSYTFISVVVPFRNEEANLKKLVHGLIEMGYPKDQFEVIFVDDHSEDASVGILKSFLNEQSNFVLTCLEAGKQGKKSALEQGIAVAKGKLIVQTDADCLVPSTWLSTINSYYQLHAHKLIIMPVRFLRAKGFFQEFQSLEFLSLMGITASFAARNNPLLCNGANLAFERKLYSSLKKDTRFDLASGDDVFLLHAAKRRSKSQIGYLHSIDATVETAPKQSLIEYVNQRRRWAGKSFYFKDFWTLFSAIVVFLFSSTLVLGFFLAWNSPVAGYCWLLFFLAKLILDYLFLKPVAGYFEKDKAMRNFLAKELMYLVYVCLVVLLSPFNVSWKGRAKPHE